MFDSSRNLRGVIFALTVAALAVGSGCGGNGGDDDSNPVDGGFLNDGAFQADAGFFVDANASDASVMFPLKVEYSYGNQVVGSQLKIDGFGTVTHSERTCCPTRTDPVVEPLLTFAQRNELDMLIRMASMGGEMTLTEPAAAGSQFGALVVFDSIGRQINIRTIASTATQRTTTYNTSPEAGQIQDLITAYVTNKMPK